MKQPQVNASVRAGARLTLAKDEKQASERTISKATD
jgi:hypothetical protein